MRVYKTVEKQAKLFGLSIPDFIGVICLIFAYVILSSLLEVFGIKPGIFGVAILITLIIALVLLLRYANNKKCPNYLFAFSSYKLLQPKKIQPICPLLKKSPEFSKTKTPVKR